MLGVGSKEGSQRLSFTDLDKVVCVYGRCVGRGVRKCYAYASDIIEAFGTHRKWSVKVKGSSIGDGQTSLQIPDLLLVLSNALNSKSNSGWI